MPQRPRRHADASRRVSRSADACGKGAPDTIADGVAGRYVISEVLDDLQEVAADAFLVSEESIRDGMRLLYRCSGLIVEPAAALGLAATLFVKLNSLLEVGSVLAGSGVEPVDTGSGDGHPYRPIRLSVC